MDEELTSKESSSMILPVLVSGAIGAGLALLLTPKSGQEIRQDLKRFASSAGEKISGQVSETAEAAKDVYEESKASISQAATEAAGQVPAEGTQAEYAEMEKSSMVVPVLISGVVGAAIALLLAPKRGTELLEDLKDIASSTRDMLAEAVEKGKGLYEQGATAVKEAMQKGKEAAVEGEEKLRPAA